MTKNIIKTGNTTEERISWFCQFFDVEMPKIEYETEEPDIGAILMSDGLLTWCATQGINLDWLFCGDVQGLVAVYRNREIERLDTQGIVDVMNQMKPEIKDGLLTAVRAVVEHNVPIKEALATFSQVANEHIGMAANG